MKTVADYVVEWYTGGDRPPPLVLAQAVESGLPDRIPPKPKDRVKRLAVAGFETETVVAAVPELSPIHVIDIINRIPGEVMTIMDLHTTGLTPVEISEVSGVTRSKVYYWLNEFDLKPHRRSRDEITARERDAVLARYAAGESVAEVAEGLGLSYDQVRYAVMKDATST